MRTLSLAAALCAAALLVSGCGGDDDSDAAATPESTAESTAESPAETEVATADAEAAIQDYFAAQRAGDAAAVCALEDEAWQTTKYGEPGQACLDDLANNTAQTVWADPVKVVTIEGADVVVDGTTGLIV